MDKLLDMYDYTTTHVLLSFLMPGILPGIISACLVFDLLHIRNFSSMLFLGQISRENSVTTH